MTLFMMGLFMIGTLGAIDLARKYTGRRSQIMLIISGSMSLWLVLVVMYSVLVESPVPQVLGLGLFPVIALLAMTLIIRNVPKVDMKEKRKAKE